MMVSKETANTVEPLLEKYSIVLQSIKKPSLQPTLGLKQHWRSEVTKYPQRLKTRLG